MASIRERSSKGGKATVQVLFRHGDRQASKTFTDRKKAEKFAGMVDLLGADRALAELLGPKKAEARLTVDELAEKFLERKAGDVTDRTLRQYRRDYKNWIQPWFGDTPAELIDEAAVQKWVDHMAKTLAPKSVGDRHMLLHSMYQFGKAKSRQLVTHNPCLETEFPPPQRKRVKGTTVPQWRGILAAADRKQAPDARDLVEYLGTVGWRFSEGIALPKRNVVVQDGRVWVDMTQVFRIIENRQVLVPETAKSFAGFRFVPVPSDDTAEMLLRRCVGLGEDDLVFTNRRGNHWNQNTFLRETWPGLLEEAGLWKGPRQSPTPHWLRHMAVAVLAAAGASPAQVQRYIGHEDISTTMDVYGGMLGGLPLDVIANAGRILSGRGGADGMAIAGQVVLGELSPRPAGQPAGAP